MTTASRQQRQRHITMHALNKEPANSKCADCPERNPVWASIVHPPVKGGKQLGVFCCYECHRYHMHLGLGVCMVKKLDVGTEWTQEEVDIMAKSGNEATNAVFEAKLWEECARTPDREDDELQDERLVFITKKYQSYTYFSEEAYWNFLDEKYPDHEIYHNNTLIRGSVIARLKGASLQWGSSKNDSQKEGKSDQKKASLSLIEKEDTDKITEEMHTLAKVEMSFLRKGQNSNLLNLRRSDTPADGCIAQWRTSRSRQSLKEIPKTSIPPTRRTLSMSNFLSSIPAPLIDMHMSDSEAEETDNDELVDFPPAEQLEGFVNYRDSIIGRIVSCETKDDSANQATNRSRSHNNNDRKLSKAGEGNSESSRKCTEKRSASTGRLRRSRNTERRGKHSQVCGERSASTGRISRSHGSKSPRHIERRHRRHRRHKRSASPKVEKVSLTDLRRVGGETTMLQEHLNQGISTNQAEPGLRKNSLPLPSLSDAKPLRPERRATYKSDSASFEMSANSFVVVGCSPDDSNYWEIMMNQWASSA